MMPNEIFFSTVNGFVVGFLILNSPYISLSKNILYDNGGFMEGIYLSGSSNSTVVSNRLLVVPNSVSPIQSSSYGMICQPDPDVYILYE